MPGKMGSFCRAGAAVKAGKGRKVPIGTERRSPRCWAVTRTERFNTKLFLGGRHILSLFNKSKLSGAAGAETKGAAGAKTKQKIKEKSQRCLSGSVDCMCQPTSWSAQATQNPSQTFLFFKCFCYFCVCVCVCLPVSVAQVFLLCVPACVYLLCLLCVCLCVSLLLQVRK